MTFVECTLARPLANLAGKEPPSELLIFDTGLNPYDNGVLLFDQEAADSVMAEFTRRGIRLHFDYAHARPKALEVEDPNPQHQKAAGWYDLEVRPGPQLWAVNIEWTPAAYQAIKDKEWGYFSPWILAEVKTGRVVELRNIALTNDPAMLGITQLVAERSKTSPPHATEDTTATAERSAAMDRAALILALGLKPETDEDEVTSVLNARLGVLQTVMTLTKSDTLDKAVSALSGVLQTRQRLLNLTGASSDGEALGRLEGWSESAKALEAAQTTIVELEKGARETKVNDLIKKGILDRKVTPAMEESLRAKGIDDPDWLAGHISALPVHQALAAKPNNTDESNTNSVVASADGKKWADLTFVQRADLYRKSPDVYKALKAEGHNKA